MLQPKIDFTLGLGPGEGKTNTSNDSNNSKEEELTEDVEEHEDITEEPEEKEHVDEDNKSEEDKLREENEQLKIQMEKLIASSKQPVSKGDNKEEEFKLVDESFVSEEEFEDILQSPKKLNEILNKVYNAGRKEVYNNTINTRKAIDEVSSKADTVSIVNEFYSANDDLVPYKNIVGLTYNRLVNEKEFKSTTELLNEVAKEVRSLLRLETPKGVRSKNDNSPALAQNKGSARQSQGGSDLTDEQKQIKSLIEDN